MDQTVALKARVGHRLSPRFRLYSSGLGVAFGDLRVAADDRRA
jgi:hypothetical protein